MKKKNTLAKCNTLIARFMNLKEDGEWVHATAQASSRMAFYISYQYSGKNFEEEVIPESVGQYIGIEDRHKEKIFEQDIIKRFNGEDYEFGVVTFSDMCFVLDRNFPINKDKRIQLEHIEWPGEYFHSCDCEIVGNCIDNGKILKRKLLT